MSATPPPDQATAPEAAAIRGIRLRLLGAVLALGAGVAGLTVAILLVRSALG
jgi:hypothetical protein